MGKIILIIIIALLPTLFGFWVVLNSKRRFQARMRRIHHRNYPPALTGESAPRYSGTPEHYSRYIGDLTCRYNAYSPYLRCAVNPDGPCKDCPYYESLEE